MSIAPTPAKRSKALVIITNDPPQPKVFLIGMMGAGKTFWADKLKKKLKVPAYDLDSLVEMMEERSVAEIFTEDGEDYFRKAESKMLRLFAEKKQYILSCGGGAACHSDNMKWMNKQGLTIWIDEPKEVIVERLVSEKEHRPSIAKLNAGEIAEWVGKKLSERETFYNQATYRLSGEEINESSLLKLIKTHA